VEQPIMSPPAVRPLPSAPAPDNATPQPLPNAPGRPTPTPTFPPDEPLLDYNNLPEEDTIEGTIEDTILPDDDDLIGQPG